MQQSLAQKSERFGLGEVSSSIAVHDQTLSQFSLPSRFGISEKATEIESAEESEPTESSENSGGMSTAKKVLIGVGGTALGAGVGTVLVLTAPVTLPIAIAAGGGTALLTWIGGAIAGRSSSNETTHGTTASSTQDKARHAVQAAAEWSDRYYKLCDQVSSRRLRDKLSTLGKVIEEIALNLQKEAEDIRVDPVFVERIERIEKHLKAYVDSDVDNSTTSEARKKRESTEEVIDIAIAEFEETKRDMLNNNYFSLELATRTNRTIFGERAAEIASRATERERN